MALSREAFVFNGFAAFPSAIALRIAFFCFHCPVILGGVLIAGVVGDALCRGVIMENAGHHWRLVEQNLRKTWQ